MRGALFFFFLTTCSLSLYSLLPGATRWWFSCQNLVHPSFVPSRLPLRYVRPLKEGSRGVLSFSWRGIGGYPLISLALGGGVPPWIALPGWSRMFFKVLAALRVPWRWPLINAVLPGVFLRQLAELDAPWTIINFINFITTRRMLHFSHSDTSPRLFGVGVP